jgi:hypothetical protein
MRTPKINTKKLAAALAPIALAGAIIAPAAAASPASAYSPAATAQARVGSPPAKEFEVHNQSSWAIKLINTTGGSSSGAFSDPPPPNGTVVHPGEAMGFQVTSYDGWGNMPTAHYAILDGNGTQIGTFDATMNNHQEAADPWHTHQVYSSECLTSLESCTADPTGVGGYDATPKPITLNSQ